MQFQYREPNVVLTKLVPRFVVYIAIEHVSLDFIKQMIAHKEIKVALTFLRCLETLSKNAPDHQIHLPRHTPHEHKLTAPSR